MSLVVSASPPATGHAVESPAPRVAAWVYGAVVAAGCGYFLLGIPIQLSDSFGNLLKLEATWLELMQAEFTQRAYLRPLLWAQLKAVYELSDGSYFLWFRGVHVAQIAALIGLFIHLVRPSTWPDVAALVFGLAVLLGIHTFTGTVVEAFPINTFLTILLCCFAAAALSFARYRWWNDGLALLLFAVAALTVESGLLVAVIFIGAALTGARGVSRAGLALVVTGIAGYFALRFVWLDVGAPGLMERASGFGFRVLEPVALIERFGADPLPFYAYNVAVSVMSVLLSEPRGGVFVLIRSVLTEPDPAAIVNVVSSASATAIIAGYVWSRRHVWRARRIADEDRLVLVFLMILPANALISYAYSKDVIMSPAGAFYALAAFVAARRLFASRATTSARALCIGVLCLIAGGGWAVREVGLHMHLRRSALVVRNEWAYAEQSLAAGAASRDVRAQILLRALKDDAIRAHPAPPALPAMDHPLIDIE